MPDTNCADVREQSKANARKQSEQASAPAAETPCVVCTTIMARAKVVGVQARRMRGRMRDANPPANQRTISSPAALQCPKPQQQRPPDASSQTKPGEFPSRPPHRRHSCHPCRPPSLPPLPASTTSSTTTTTAIAATITTIAISTIINIKNLDCPQLVCKSLSNPPPTTTPPPPPSQPHHHHHHHHHHRHHHHHHHHTTTTTTTMPAARRTPRRQVRKHAAVGEVK
ncbi:hypothetical protein PLESTM_000302800 [Pleodorina starrii]|nr:hypothetical protein PLESTM_000302800 [Pleodorina starrii]